MPLPDPRRPIVGRLVTRDGAPLHTLWQRLVIDTAVVDFVERGRMLPRVRVFAEGATMPLVAFLEAVGIRYRECLKPRLGTRPMTLAEFELGITQHIGSRETLHALGALKMSAFEAERTAAANVLERTGQKAAEARGMAALLAAAAAIGKAIPTGDDTSGAR